MKTLKIYLKNCPESSNTKIYCIKHDNGENLESLKEKIHLRVPQLRFSGVEPMIYWFDLENDKIRITCDDDLKFFMEESEIRKLIFEYQIQQDSSRKRRSTQLIDNDIDDDDHSECSKRLRKIDLSSDSSMDTESEEVIESVEQERICESSFENAVPSTSQIDNVPAKVVNIISVETIEPINDDALNNNSVDNQVVVVEEVADEEENSSSNNTTDSGNETSNEDQQSKERRNSESNRIVISDSSDDEEEDANANNNRFYNNRNNNSFYSYSFANAGINGARVRSNENFRNFFNNNIHESQRRMFREQAFIRENIRMAHNNARDTIRVAQENARASMQMARMTVENARRNVQNQMLQNFRAHFQPLFYSSFQGSYRR